MKVEIKVPSPGESITEVQIAAWLVSDGDHVDENQDVVEVDSDKATLSVAASASGKISILVEEGKTIDVNSVIAEIDTSAKGKIVEKALVIEEVKEEHPTESEKPVTKEEPVIEQVAPIKQLNISPLARKIMDSNSISEKDINEFLQQHRVGKKDVEYFIEQGGQNKVSSNIAASSAWSGGRETKRIKMSMLRKKISQRDNS